MRTRFSKFRQVDARPAYHSIFHNSTSPHRPMFLSPVTSQESRASLIPRPLLRNSYPSFLQFGRTIFLPVLGYFLPLLLFTIPLPPLFVRLFSTHQAPPVMLYPYFVLVALIEQPWERFSLFVLFLFCFSLHLYTPARFSRHFLLAITLSLFSGRWFSFYIVFLNHFHCIKLKRFGYFLSIRSYLSFWF